LLSCRSYQVSGVQICDMGNIEGCDVRSATDCCDTDANKGKLSGPLSKNAQIPSSSSTSPSKAGGVAPSSTLYGDEEASSKQRQEQKKMEEATKKEEEVRAQMELDNQVQTELNNQVVQATINNLKATESRSDKFGALFDICDRNHSGDLDAEEFFIFYQEVERIQAQQAQQVQQKKKHRKPLSEKRRLEQRSQSDQIFIVMGVDATGTELQKVEPKVEPATLSGSEKILKAQFVDYYVDVLENWPLEQVDQFCENVVMRLQESSDPSVASGA